MKILVVGHSHVIALTAAYEEGGELLDDIQIYFLSCLEDRFLVRGEWPRVPRSVNLELLLEDFLSLAGKVDAVVFYLNGNEHSNKGMFESDTRTYQAVEALVKMESADHCEAWLQSLLPHSGALRRVLLLPPPPVESAEVILGTRKVARFGRPLRIRDADQRIQLWRIQCAAVSDVARKNGLAVLSPPSDVFSASGFLAEDCASGATHGNSVYGTRVLTSLISYLSAEEVGKTKEGAGADVREHPYRSLPTYCFWKQSIGRAAKDAVDPCVDPPFRIGPRDKVATAGSCFAQHISKQLRTNGFRFLATESARQDDREGGATAFHDFSARYGNIYTARQLLQLFDRAFGYFRPLERVWGAAGGRFCDPFRPTIESGGYASKDAVIQDARRHLAAVRRMFRELDVFVFTLGLTECWLSRLDGAVYPMAPGVAGGEYDPGKHVFVNFGVTDVVGDMRVFLRKLRLVNPNAKVILTVSPVPLAATYENRHVLVSTTYSKSVLRVAAEELASTIEGVYYFPSYEIIMGSYAAGGYFEADGRTVTPDGVSHVMRVFMAHLTEERPGDEEIEGDELDNAMEALGEALCDEEMLAR